MKDKLVVAAAVNSQVGECPLWDKRSGDFLFLDIRGKCIWKRNGQDGNLTKIDLPQQIGCMALCTNGDLLAAMEDGIYRTGNGVNFIKAHQDIKIKGRRFNDGKVGPDGAFYLGTTDDDGNGAFYRLRDGVLCELFDGCFCANGIDWTADGGLMYYTDSPKQTVEMFDFDIASGTLQNRRTFTEIPKEAGLPDGMTLDENGDLWVALWNGHRIIHIDKNTGKIKGEIEVPCPKASCCVFGGEDMSELYITTAAMNDTDQYPMAGYVFRATPGVRGRAINYYRY